MSAAGHAVHSGTAPRPVRRSPSEDRDFAETLGGAGLLNHGNLPGDGRIVNARAIGVAAPPRRVAGHARLRLDPAARTTGAELLMQPWNAASIRVAEECGFSPDGLVVRARPYQRQADQELAVPRRKPSTNMGVSRTADLAEA